MTIHIQGSIGPEMRAQLEEDMEAQLRDFHRVAWTAHRGLHLLEDRSSVGDDGSTDIDALFRVANAAARTIRLRQVQGNLRLQTSLVLPRLADAIVLRTINSANARAAGAWSVRTDDGIIVLTPLIPWMHAIAQVPVLLDEVLRVSDLVDRSFEVLVTELAVRTDA